MVQELSPDVVFSVSAKKTPEEPTLELLADIRDLMRQSVAVQKYVLYYACELDKKISRIEAHTNIMQRQLEKLKR